MYEKQKMTFERAAEIFASAGEACEIGRKAILKQIPQSPQYLHFPVTYDESASRTDIAECPNCGSIYLRRRSNELMSLNWGCAYCPDCGQALDWGDRDATN